MKRTFGLIIILMIIVLIGSYKFSTNNPVPPEIAEEDYLILGDEPPFQMKPLPEEEVEVTVDQETAEQVVELKEAGFSLKLPPDLRVVTREVEPGRVLIYRGDKCRVVVSDVDSEGAKNLEEWIKIEEEYQKDSFGPDLKKFSISKIEDFKKFDAYSYETDTVQFGLEASILFEKENSIYSISKSNQSEDCISIREILDSIIFQ